MTSSKDIFEAYKVIEVAEDGTFTIPASFVMQIKTYFPKTKIELVARKLRSRRSLHQNSFLHLLIGIFSVELINLTGDRIYTPEIVKEMLKLKFLKTDIVDEKTGEVKGQYIKCTHELKISEMADFISKIMEYALNEFGIKLPSANEQLRLIE